MECELEGLENVEATEEDQKNVDEESSLPHSPLKAEWTSMLSEIQDSSFCQCC